MGNTQREGAQTARTDTEASGAKVAHDQAVDNAPDLETLTHALCEALSDFLENPQFVCTVGGNPIRVEAMLARARAALAKARGTDA